MNLTSRSMQDVIMRNIGDINVDPQLKKLLDELNSLEQEIYGTTKPKNEAETTKKDSDKKVLIHKNHTKKCRKPRGDGETFKVAASMFGEKRKSDRLAGKIPKFDLNYDIDELEIEKLFNNGQLRRSKQERYFSRGVITSDRVILQPEEITAEILNSISYKMSDKKYDKVNGSSCHQCRQKTIDTKTICRNLECFGVRGQFCGPCAKNRYGVDIKDALLDPYWSCFVCQGVCNCSFCRSRKGKRPTGILAPMAKREGHKSVKEFLDKIGEGDDYNEYMQNPESVLGFIGQDTVCTVGGNKKLLNVKEADDAAVFISAITDSVEDNSHFCGFTEDSIPESKKNKLDSIIKLLSKN